MQPTGPALHLQPRAWKERLCGEWGLGSPQRPAPTGTEGKALSAKPSRGCSPRVGVELGAWRGPTIQYTQRPHTKKLRHGRGVQESQRWPRVPSAASKSVTSWGPGRVRQVAGGAGPLAPSPRVEAFRGGQVGSPGEVSGASALQCPMPNSKANKCFQGAAGVQGRRGAP